jgi:hypothetical protein
MACAPTTIKTDHIPEVTGKSQIIVIYFAASDCPYCIKWEENNKGFLESDESKFIAFHAIRREYFVEPLNKGALPDDLQWVLEQTKVTGTPTFIVIVDRNILLQTSKWDEEVLPLIKELVSLKKASLKKVNE